MTIDELRKNLGAGCDIVAGSRELMVRRIESGDYSDRCRYGSDCRCAVCLTVSAIRADGR